ncbi:GNAT family N-acetyltransferase [Shewanella sp. CG12_big_fil_rev_8_21_14_0_65_47_15]|uniref:GNAT family N-acetyltransferase n=1 Tax=Shewanella sp. CG12_big_fil_rev_8_21_14_0_65_47_15 TaxID=1975537 RepID=UPI000CB73F56|nr:GNAT family N-acetyltransferase [Shewanella sp. CG12_big_fil_rev_8_21_14_0_65_47_15]PIW62814.1 MAG: N-acetyltransferase [Shewanella sp. CG12_big_fil_rev_8_21_14_0_65_47_15]
MITQTERLIIRPFTEQDIDALFLMNSIPAMLKYIPTAAFTSREQAEALFHNVILQDYQQRGFGRWAVEHKADNKVIGFCGPKFIPEFNEVELGYRYFPEYWGMGIGSEAALAALKAFPQFGIDKTIALILEGNVGSEGVAKRVGMHWREQNEFMGHRVNIYAKVLS